MSEPEKNGGVEAMRKDLEFLAQVQALNLSDPKSPLYIGGLNPKQRVAALDATNRYLEKIQHMNAPSDSDQGTIMDFTRETVKFCRDTKQALGVGHAGGQQDPAAKRLVRSLDQLQLTAQQNAWYNGIGLDEQQSALQAAKPSSAHHPAKPAAGGFSPSPS